MSEPEIGCPIPRTDTSKYGTEKKIRISTSSLAVASTVESDPAPNYLHGAK